MVDVLGPDSKHKRGSNLLIYVNRGKKVIVVFMVSVFRRIRMLLELPKVVVLAYFYTKIVLAH